VTPDTAQVSRIQRRQAATSSASSVAELLQNIANSRGAALEQERDLSLTSLLPPTDLLGCTEAAKRLATGVEQQQRFLIVGDFDADGATSVAVAVLALRAFGARNVDFLVPNRFEYGYGLTPEIVEVARDYQPDILITVDNGIASHEGVARAKSLGWQVIVTDHHLAAEILPDADAIVNPNQPGCGFKSKALAGVGVIFYVMSAVRGELRARDYFERAQIVEPAMADWLDIVALGTVADVVPLDHNNRILVEQGLRRMRAGQLRPGIQALLELTRRDVTSLVAADLAFAVAPRINAAGRLEDMAIGIRCLLAATSSEAIRLATELDRLNGERRVIEQSMKNEAAEALTQMGTIASAADCPSVIVLHDPRWHQGVIGILASRIKEQFHRPVIIFARDGESQLKGSARSIPGLHIRDILDSVATAHPGLVVKFGGHAMAAGLTIACSDYERFTEALTSVVDANVTEEILAPIKLSDGPLSSDFFTLECARSLRFYQPWGQHFPEPLFDNHFDIKRVRILSEQHAKLEVALSGEQICFSAIAFNVDPEFYLQHEGRSLRLLYKLDINSYRGTQSLQLMIEHAESGLQHSL
jgi:single-stranded-DNA-specific exonuclease